MTMICRAAKLRLFNFLSLFRDLQKPTRFSGGGGGGGSSRIVAPKFFPESLRGSGTVREGVVEGFFRELHLRNPIFTQ